MPHPDAKCILFNLNAALLQYYVSTWFKILKSLSPDATFYLWAPVTFFRDKENLSYVLPGYKSAEEPFPSSKKRIVTWEIKIRWKLTKATTSLCWASGAQPSKVWALIGLSNLLHATSLQPYSLWHVTALEPAPLSACNLLQLTPRFRISNISNLCCSWGLQLHSPHLDVPRSKDGDVVRIKF